MTDNPTPAQAVPDRAAELAELESAVQRALDRAAGAGVEGCEVPTSAQGGLELAVRLGEGETIDVRVRVTPARTQRVSVGVGIESGVTRRGESLEQIQSAMHMVAEGVKSSPSVLDLARRYGVEMPITEQVVAVCHEGRSARDALAAVMSRSNKSEFD